MYGSSAVSKCLETFAGYLQFKINIFFFFLRIILCPHSAQTSELVHAIDACCLACTRPSPSITLLSLLPLEICAVSRIPKKEIGRCFKLILKALETSVDLITTGDFMSRFCSNLGLPKQVQMAATHIARKAVELDLVPGRSPISVAAAAIYMASQASADKRTQKGK